MSNPMTQESFELLMEYIRCGGSKCRLIGSSGMIHCLDCNSHMDDEELFEAYENCIERENQPKIIMSRKEFESSIIIIGCRGSKCQEHAKFGVLHCTDCSGSSDDVDWDEAYQFYLDGENVDGAFIG